MRRSIRLRKKIMYFGKKPDLNIFRLKSPKDSHQKGMDPKASDIQRHSSRR